MLSPGFVHQMSECLDCRACAAVCPSGVEYGELVEAARARIEQAVSPKRAPAARFVRWFALRFMFGNLAVMRIIAALLRFGQRSGLQRFAVKLGLLRALGLDRAVALAPAICSRFFVPRNQRFPAADARCTVLLHAGCIMQVAFTHWHEATIRVLQRNACTVLAPSGQGCCGAIAVHAGDVDFARRLAKRNIEAFERSGAQWYIVNAAGCGCALKEYPQTFVADSAWAHRARAFSDRVRDVLEFLDQLGISDEMAPVAATVTYQDACHLAHAQHVADAPRRLLQRIPGLHLMPMPESAVCCGSAGVYNLAQPEMAGRLGRRKAENVAASGAQIVATGNPGCALQMAAHLRERGDAIETVHAIELLDRAYENYSEATSRSRSFSAASSEE